MTQLQSPPISEDIPLTDVQTAHAKAVELGQHMLRMTTASGSGHPSSALAISHIVVQLMYRTMRYDLNDPWSLANDRLVLSIGHAVPAIYAAYADLGGVVGNDKALARKLTVDDLLQLRQQNSLLDGHPNPAEGFPFFDAATGSLGQGLSVAAGLALTARLDGIDKRIYVIIGDGEAREGQVWEAADFAVDHKLHNVCAIFSCNGHGQADSVSTQQSADAIAAKARAFGWHVVEIDGHDPSQIANALEVVGSVEKPLAIVARTVKGWGVEMMLGKNFHGKPIPQDKLDEACGQLVATGKTLGVSKTATWSPAAPTPVHQTKAPAKIELPSFEKAVTRVGLESALEKKRLATRVAYGAALVALGDVDDRVVSLDGDVSNSTFANMFAKHHADRFIECKIAEQNMITAAAGMAAAGKIPFASSFAKFIARAADQIDMAAISRANIKIVGSHSGVSLGADGPSQMAVSDVAYFRSLTRVDTGGERVGCRLFHPSDPICAYRCVELMANVEGMCYLRTHRPDAPFLYDLNESFGLEGFKQLREGDKLTLVSSGYMLHTVLEAAKKLDQQGIRCHVFDVYALPLATGPILEAARNAGGTILTVEDNYIGGLHAELAEAAAESGDVRVHGLTARKMPKSAITAAEIFTHVGVGEAYILKKATSLVEG